MVPGLPTSSSTTPTTTSISASQDCAFDVSKYAENPVHERSGSVTGELLGNRCIKSSEAENKNKDEGHEDVQTDLLRDLPDWPHEFRENLVDESSPLEPRRHPAPKDQDTSSSSHELPNGVASKSGIGLGQAQYSHSLPERLKLRYLLEDEKRGLLAEDVLVQSCPERSTLVTR